MNRHERRAIRKRAAPDPQTLHELGVAALREGRIDDAVKTFQQVIFRAPHIPEAHSNLSLALLKQGLCEASVKSAERALELRPDFAGARNNLGLALQQLNRHSEAIAQFEKMLAAGQVSQARQNLAISFQALGRYEEAIATFEAALTDNPRSADLHRNLGMVLVIVGQIERAARAFEYAIELDPSQPASYRCLAEVRRMRADDPLLASMERLGAEIDRFSAADQIELHFGLGKALADAGQYARSFSHYLAGNALKRREIAYNEAATFQLFDRIRMAVTPEFLSAHRDWGERSSVPIFIIGMPRSGTTLVEQILVSHPNVATGGERTDFVKQSQRLLSDDTTPFSFVDHLGELPPERFRQLGAAYLAAIRPIAATAERIIDKAPGNFRFLGLIHAALPNARIIHVQRNPIDNCLSIFAQLFGAPQSFAYELGELGRYWVRYDALMAYWRSVLPEGVMLDLSYEELVRDFEPQTRRLFRHCGLEWHPACLTFYKTERPVETASRAQVRQPLYSSSIERWRPDAALLKPLLEALGQ